MSLSLLLSLFSMLLLVSRVYRCGDCYCDDCGCDVGPFVVVIVAVVVVDL